MSSVSSPPVMTTGRQQLTHRSSRSERTAERLYMQGCLVELGSVAPLQIEHVERELTSGDDDGPPTINPPFVQIGTYRRAPLHAGVPRRTWQCCSTADRACRA